MTTQVFIKPVEFRSAHYSAIAGLNTNAAGPSYVNSRTNPGIESADLYVETHEGDMVRAFKIQTEKRPGALVELVRAPMGDKGYALAESLSPEMKQALQIVAETPGLHEVNA